MMISRVGFDGTDQSSRTLMVHGTAGADADAATSGQIQNELFTPELPGHLCCFRSLRVCVLLAQVFQTDNEICVFYGCVPAVAIPQRCAPVLGIAAFFAPLCSISNAATTEQRC